MLIIECSTMFDMSKSNILLISIFAKDACMWARANSRKIPMCFFPQLEKQLEILCDICWADLNYSEMFLFVRLFGTRIH